MADVQLPSINQGETDIKKMVSQLLNAYIVLTEELTYLLNNLDTRNINEVDGDLLVTGTVTAIKLQVDELSAITANLGKITSGEMYGAYIATREDAFPRAEMSNTDDLFGAYFNANEGIKIQADYGGGPSLNFIHAGNIIARLDMLLGYLETSAIGNYEITTSSNGNIYLNPGGSGAVQLRKPDFSKFTNQNTDLQTELDLRATAGLPTGSAGAHNHGITPGTQLMTVGGGFVTWVGAGDHVHIEN